MQNPAADALNDLGEREITSAVVCNDVHEHGSIHTPECMVLATVTTILARHEYFSGFWQTHAWSYMASSLTCGTLRYTVLWYG